MASGKEGKLAWGPSLPGSPPDSRALGCWLMLPLHGRSPAGSAGLSQVQGRGGLGWRSCRGGGQMCPRADALQGRREGLEVGGLQGPWCTHSRGRWLLQASPGLCRWHWSGRTGTRWVAPGCSYCCGQNHVPALIPRTVAYLGSRPGCSPGHPHPNSAPVKTGRVGRVGPTRSWAGVGVGALRCPCAEPRVLCSRPRHSWGPGLQSLGVWA